MRWRLRTPVLMLCDTILINLAILIPYSIFLNERLTSEHLDQYYILAAIATVVMLAVISFFKLYNRVWAYASTGELRAIIRAVTLGSVIIYLVTHLIETGIPSTIIVVFWAFTIIFIGGSRLAWRVYLRPGMGNRTPEETTKKKRTLIYGAGDAGALVAREFNNHYNGSHTVIGFLDDNPRKHNLIIHDIPVLGGIDKLYRVVQEYKVNEIIIAMPSAPGAEVRKIVETCKACVDQVLIVPGVYEILDGKVTLNKIRPVQIEDLLGREAVEVNIQEISQYLKNKVVMITGAGGSIGSELCRQVAQIGAKKLVLLGHGENSLHEIWLELKDYHPALDMEIEIADVRDVWKLEIVFARHRPQVVFHAAAHKHVPLMELHPDEAVKTNIFGTKNMAEMADRFHCETFIYISTDKAVNPSSVMGATKRMAELIIHNMFKGSKTKYAAVRFGNVLGSSGSVIPIFKKQIARGGPVTITHPEMKRYFMTIPEAVHLVIQAGAMAKGGEVFVLDMGEPVRIVDLAINLIRFSGLEPGKDIEIKITGIRPGEKLFEELLTAEEGSDSTRHKRIYIARPVEIDQEALIYELGKLAKREVTNGEEIFEALGRIVPRFRRHYKEQVG